MAALSLAALVVLLLYVVLSWQRPRPGDPDPSSVGHAGYGPWYDSTAPGGTDDWSDGTDWGSVSDGGGDGGC